MLLLTDVPENFTRVNEFEPHLTNGTFVSCPIKSITDCYGAFFMEANDINNFACNIELEIIEVICNTAGGLFEKIKLFQLFNNYVSYEINFNILTENAFKTRVNEEYSKAIDSNQKPIIAFVSLDKYNSIADKIKQNFIFNHIIENIKPNLKSFEFIGRVNAEVIGIMFFNRDVSKVKIISERVRQQLSTQYIEISKEKLSATISVGIAALKQKDSFETFISNATMALRYAQKKTNYVQVFE